MSPRSRHSVPLRARSVSTLLQTLSHPALGVLSLSTLVHQSRCRSVSITVGGVRNGVRYRGKQHRERMLILQCSTPAQTASGHPPTRFVPRKPLFEPTCSNVFRSTPDSETLRHRHRVPPRPTSSHRVLPRPTSPRRVPRLFRST